MSVYGISPVLFETVSHVTATNSVEVGTLRREGDEIYRYVYNAGNSQISPGYGCTLSAVTGYSVTVSSITSVDAFVGLVKHATLTTGTYGWTLVHGFGQVQMEADNSAAAGQLLTVAADGEFAMKSNSTGYPAPVVGKAMAAIASGASGTAFFNVLGAC
jgi:hypothetical protein